MVVIDEQIMDAVVGMVVVLVPILGAWLKKVMADKGVGEAQVDQIFDFADAELEGIFKLYPNSQEVTELRIKLAKLRAFYNDPKTTEAELKALMSAVQSIRFRTLKTT